MTSLTPCRLSSKIWPIFLAHFQDINTGFFSCRYSKKSRKHTSSNVFCVFLLSYRSVLVRNLAISSLDSSPFFGTLVNKWLGRRAWKRGWWMVYLLPIQPRLQINIPSITIDQPRFHDNTIELMVYCSHLPKLVNASYEELAGSFEPIRNGEIFWMNNNSPYME